MEPFARWESVEIYFCQKRFETICWGFPWLAASMACVVDFFFSRSNAAFLCDGGFVHKSSAQIRKEKEEKNLIYFEQIREFTSQKIRWLRPIFIHVKQIFSLNIGNRVRFFAVLI